MYSTKVKLALIEPLWDLIIAIALPSTI